MRNVLLTLFALVALVAFGEPSRQVELSHEHIPTSPVTGPYIERSPMRLPTVEVLYYPESGYIETKCKDGNIPAEVYLYSANGSLVGYSPEINSTLSITSEGLHTIKIVSTSWTLTGDFEV